LPSPGTHSGMIPSQLIHTQVLLIDAIFRCMFLVNVHQGITHNAVYAMVGIIFLWVQ
jgi:hypothetical protein